jgi:hypothetical protein
MLTRRCEEENKEACLLFNLSSHEDFDFSVLWAPSLKREHK